MKGDIDLRELKNVRVSARVVKITVSAILLIAIILLGWRYVTHPPRPWLVRWKLDRYLAKQARHGDFKVDFTFPSKAEMAKSSKEDDKGPLRGSRTGKDFEALREDYLSEKTTLLALEREVTRAEARLKESKAKLDTLTRELADAQTASDSAKVTSAQASIAEVREQIAGLEKTAQRRAELQTKTDALASVTDDLWEFQRVWIADAAASDAAGSTGLAKARADLVASAEKKLRDASSYEAMYHTLGEELYVAKRLLESGNTAHQREGATIALAVARQSLEYAMNGYVAARVVEGYILPHVDLATDRNTRSVFNEENLLRQCADIFNRNEEANNVVRTYELYLESVQNPARQDWARFQIAQAYRQAGDAKQELSALRSIKDTNTFRFQMRRIAQLEQDLKSR